MRRQRQPNLALNSEQVRALGSPVREAIISIVSLHGPVSTADMGRMLGRDPKVLYYQVRQLVGLGLLEPAGLRHAKFREEQLYDVVADQFSLDLAPGDPDYRRAVAETGEATIRNAAHEFRLAVETEEREENARLIRVFCRLSDAHLQELVRRLMDVRAYAVEHDEAAGTRVAVTMVVTGLE